MCLNLCTAKVCKNDDIRLVGGGVDYEGRVEYCDHGAWGTICDTGWTASDAAVVCHQLGLPSEGEFNIDLVCVLVCVPVSTSVTTVTGAVAFAGATFGQGTGPLVLAGVECIGTEPSMNTCPSGNTSSCHHTDDAGVRCLSKMSDPCSSLVENYM